MERGNRPPCQSYSKKKKYTNDQISHNHMILQKKSYVPESENS